MHRGGRPILHDVELEIGVGETLGVVGPSGAGKSTLALALLGLIRVSAGTVRFDDRPLPELDRRELSRRTALVLQDPQSSLDPRLRAGESVEEPLRIHGRASRETRRRRVRELFTSLELSPEEERRYPHELSGGQAQRVALARALACDPDLLVLDEPTAGLDLSVRARLLDLLEDLRSRRSGSLMVITHDGTIVDAVCQRVVVVENGRVAARSGIPRGIPAPL